ncbi:DHA2 family efflux MFS transporter permease subunit [Ornithinibacillus halophilus]|uniref:Drug resistance transporter, EmrB/QacA subfamily n=1 Tax=Ornithinibacillus halophilus TaxID=930117 RepID=A0A1M5LAE4_9BACI|nr:DHA2 family efflux MFS transporter permease subunit [Ornithinibacillus halophilus]SHG61905.1 drug resistance transporter, EmrB/QacA subfamily [Ornithinibacillus halophilus]
MEEKVAHKGIIVVILATAFLFTFSQFLLITAYPTIMDEFDLNATQVQWLTTAFLLTTIIFIPLTGYLSDTFTAKTLVVCALSSLVIGTVIGGLSPNFGTLILSRVIQAIGAGIILPLVQTILLKVFPYHRRGFAMGLLGAVVNVAPATAPSVSGMIIDFFSWRFLHWMLLPLIIITLVFAVFVMKNVLEKQDAKIDLLSIVLSAIGFAFFIFGLSTISVTGFSEWKVILPLSIGLMALMIFIHRQLKLSKPVLNIKLFSNATFRLVMILVFINMMLLLSAETILPMFAQDVLGTSAFLSGFLLVPGTVILSIVTIISGNLYDRYGGKKISIIGFACTFTSLILLNTVGMESSPYWIMIHFCLFMTGFGLTLMTLVTVSMNALEDKDIAHGSAIVNTVRQFGMTFGIIILSTIISLTTSNMDTSYEVGTYWGTTYAFAVMAILALVGLVLTTLMKDRVQE